jgi:6-phosphogluconolactonase (cycloisomerase 2 family)
MGLVDSCATALMLAMGVVSIAAPVRAQFVYIGLTNGTIESVRINPNGSLTQVGSPFAAPVGLMVVTPSALPDGDGPKRKSGSKFLYTVYNTLQYLPGFVSGFSIGATGALTPAGTTTLPPLQSFPLSMAADPAGKSLYIGRYLPVGGENPLAYDIGANGSLTLLGSQIATQDRLRQLAVSPNGRFLYAEAVSALDNQSMVVMAIGSDGSLSQVGSPIAAGFGIRPFVIDPTGRFLYLANNNLPTNVDNILEYRIGSDGRLTLIGSTPDAPIIVGVIPVGTLPSGMAADPDGQFIYASQSSATDNTKRYIQVYRINSNGTLTAIGSPIGQGGALAVDPAGRFLYELIANAVNGYRILPNGRLNPISSFPLGVPASTFVISACNTGEDDKGQCHSACNTGEDDKGQCH